MHPLITVITVCLNSETIITKTIESVLNQTYPNIEYIIIDGLSIDNTVTIIKNYENKFKEKNFRYTWISEKDHGIYHAMSKGIMMASGSWVAFMNAGDWFYDNDVISKIFKKDRSKFDLIYGDHEVRYDERYNGFKRLQKAGPINNLFKGLVFSHQSLFTRLKLLKEIGINRNGIKIANDYRFVVQSYIEGKKFLKTDIVVASIIAGGLSDNGSHRIIALYENLKIARKAWGNRVLPYHFYKLAIVSIFTFLQKLLPKKIQPFFIKLLK